MSLDLPKDFFLFKVNNGEVAGEISESEAEMGGGTGCEGPTFDSPRVLNGGNDFELSLGELGDLNEASGLGTLPAHHEFSGVWYPLHVVGSVVC